MEISGGDKLNKYLTDLGLKLGSKKAVDIGFPGGATYPDGTSVALVATFNEFGTRRSPPRPFMRATVAKHASEWGPALAANLKDTDYNVETALGRVGEGVAGQIKQEISTLTQPALAPSTVRRKGSSKPLVDTGVMLRSVTWVVR